MIDDRMYLFFIKIDGFKEGMLEVELPNMIVACLNAIFAHYVVPF